MDFVCEVTPTCLRYGKAPGTISIHTGSSLKKKLYALALKMH